MVTQLVSPVGPVASTVPRAGRRPLMATCRKLQKMPASAMVSLGAVPHRIVRPAAPGAVGTASRPAHARSISNLATKVRSLQGAQCTANCEKCVIPVSAIQPTLPSTTHRGRPRYTSHAAARQSRAAQCRRRQTPACRQPSAAWVSHAASHPHDPAAQPDSQPRSR